MALRRSELLFTCVFQASIFYTKCEILTHKGPTWRSVAHFQCFDKKSGKTALRPGISTNERARLGKGWLWLVAQIGGHSFHRWQINTDEWRWAANVFKNVQPALLRCTLKKLLRCTMYNVLKHITSVVSCTILPLKWEQIKWELKDLFCFDQN